VIRRLVKFVTRRCNRKLRSHLSHSMPYLYLYPNNSFIGSQIYLSQISTSCYLPHNKIKDSSEARESKTLNRPHKEISGILERNGGFQVLPTKN
jgi:hypothetical protein